jgi:O-antigen biosynthesis protein
LSFTTGRVGLQIGRRYRQFRQLWGTEGLAGITERMRRAAAEWLAPKDVIMPVRRADVVAADLSRPFQAAVPRVMPGQPLIINWVTTPAGPGSGGHTTLFRIIRYMEAHGYINRVYFYDVYRGDHHYYESIVRRYYDFRGSVARVDDGMEDAHIVVATGWPTAYPVFNSRCTGKRFYFVQDFEPYFYPIGSMSLLAESTYRMGFHAITIGRCFAEKLSTEFGMTVDSFKYGCDTSRYSRLENSRRSGVVFYARRETPRRGFELGIMALEVFAARRPEVELHIVGDKIGKLPFAFVDHGHVTPNELNEIYNHCYAGLSLSFTNVSLVALEMLAAGCIPVVNDTVQVRTDLENSFVRYALPNPHALAAELEALVMTHDFESLSRAAAASVRSSTWDDAGAAVDAIFRQSIGSHSQPAATEVSGTLTTSTY